MSGELAISALAVVASTTTALVGMIVTSRAQRTAVREQNLWRERTNTYLGLQQWVDEIHAWFDFDRHDPPELCSDSSRMVPLFASPFVLDHLSAMRKVVRNLRAAYQQGDWVTYDNLRFQLDGGFAIDLSALLRDEMTGRQNEYVVGQHGAIRLSARSMWMLKWRYRRQRLPWRLLPSRKT